MTKWRILVSSIIYFVIVGILLVLGFKFSGFLGWIELILLSFLSHVGVNCTLRKLFRKKKGGKVNV